MAQNKINNSRPITVLMDLDNSSHQPKLVHTKLSNSVDKILLKIGNCMSWVWVLLMAVIILNVVMRYLFNQGRIEFEELQWHLYALGWLFGLSYCYVTDDHVRVDLIHEGLSIKAKAWIEILGIVFLLIPFLSLVLLYAVPFILYSWELNEISGAPGGLPYRWAIKSVLFVGFSLLALATISRLSRVFAMLFMRPDSPFILAEKK